MKRLLVVLVIAAFFCSCHNHMQEGQKILKQFDSIDKSLDRDKMADGRSSLYKSVRTKYRGTATESLINGMEEEVDRFNNFIGTMRSSFYKHCGDVNGEAIPVDKEEDRGLTNSFFLDKPGTGAMVWGYLQRVIKRLEPNAGSVSTKKMIEETYAVYIDKYDAGKKLAVDYFKDNPPVAAITILNSFATRIKNIETQILNDYLNN